jgi:LysM repeat protein
MGLRDKYSHAIQVAKGLRMQGSAEEKDGKLHFNGTVNSEDEKNQIWNALKTVPDWRTDIVAEIRVVAVAAPRGGAQEASQETTARTYTVKAGDTLSAIARQQLGDGTAYMKIFEANRDQLSDPDKIKPGQVLRIPS